LPSTIFGNQKFYYIPLDRPFKKLFSLAYLQSHKQTPLQKNDKDLGEIDKYVVSIFQK